MLTVYFVLCHALHKHCSYTSCSTWGKYIFSTITCIPRIAWILKPYQRLYFKLRDTSEETTQNSNRNLHWDCPWRSEYGCIEQSRSTAPSVQLPYTDQLRESLHLYSSCLLGAPTTVPQPEWYPRQVALTPQQQYHHSSVPEPFWPNCRAPYSYLCPKF